jgi:hypothetical protein
MSITKFELDQLPDNLLVDSYTKDEVDSLLANKLTKSGDTVTGSLIVPTPVQSGEVTNKDYVDTAVAEAKKSALVFKGFIGTVRPSTPKIGDL